MITIGGIHYKEAKVTLLNESGLGVAELAARTCYDSFNGSENEAVKNFHKTRDIEGLNSIEGSELLDNLAWVHHHHSIIEHATLSFLIEGFSRGVLQEHARHRLQSISVRSTRYTMSTILNAYMSCDNFKDLVNLWEQADFLVYNDYAYRLLEYEGMAKKLDLHREELGDEEFEKLCLSKGNIEILHNERALDFQKKFSKLQEGKQKRNVGDPFKHLVSDNWKVDMVITFNIRSLKNFFDLRDSGAAWAQIRALAKGMKAVTPHKYLKLIDKNAR